MRTPVKLPGPRPKARASKDCSDKLASSKALFTIGKIFCVCSRGEISKREATTPSFQTATVQDSVAVSIAKIRSDTP